ncbi:MAG: hypothetical protein ABSF93_04475, partial [Candidatus Sulfotelmatobacter sp.]
PREEKGRPTLYRSFSFSLRTSVGIGPANPARHGNCSRILRARTTHGGEVWWMTAAKGYSRHLTLIALT